MGYYGQEQEMVELFWLTASLEQPSPQLTDTVDRSEHSNLAHVKVSLQLVALILYAQDSLEKSTALVIANVSKFKIQISTYARIKIL